MEREWNEWSSTYGVIRRWMKAFGEIQLCAPSVSMDLLHRIGKKIKVQEKRTVDKKNKQWTRIADRRKEEATFRNINTGSTENVNSEGRGRTSGE